MRHLARPLSWFVRWSCGAVWSARRPVKPEVAGSNPVRTAQHHGRVAQLVERAPEKREVRGSTPRPTTTRNAAQEPGPVRAKDGTNAPLREESCRSASR